MTATLTQQTTRFIADQAITSAKIDSSVAPAVLATKFIPGRDLAPNFTTSAANSDDVTTAVTAVATTPTNTANYSSLGIFTGTVSGGGAEIVIIRQPNSQLGFDDGAGGLVFGVLSWFSSVYTLNYYKADGTGYTWAAPTTIDMYFVEVFNAETVPPAALTALGVFFYHPATNPPVQYTQQFTLNSTDITNKYVTLSHTPVTAANVTMFVKGSGPMVYGDDYSVSTNQLTWNGFALDTVLQSGDKIVIQYWA